VLDNNEYALMSSIGLSAVFDVVDVKLLTKILKMVGLPNNVISLIEVCLAKRTYNVTINRICSTFYNLGKGIIQGSILGSFPYATRLDN
jgi:hypothetical protein